MPKTYDKRVENRKQCSGMKTVTLCGAPLKSNAILLYLFLLLNPINNNLFRGIFTKIEHLT